MSKKIVREICLLFLLSVIFPASSVKAQIDKKLDEKYFKEAMKDAKTIEPNEIKKDLQVLSASETPILVIHLTENSCDDYKKAENKKHFANKDDVWVTLFSEMKSVFQDKKMAGELGNVENRLKKLLGLKWKPNYKCFVELKVATNKITRPTPFFDWQGNQVKPTDSVIENKIGDYPFTNLGYTCDWYYGDGCRYGLTEFKLVKENDSIIVNACETDESLEENCLSQSLETNDITILKQ